MAETTWHLGFRRRDDDLRASQAPKAMAVSPAAEWLPWEGDFIGNGNHDMRPL